jgi:hypothetical protein
MEEGNGKSLSPLGKVDIHNLEDWALNGKERITSRVAPRAFRLLGLTCAAICGGFLWWLSSCFITSNARIELGISSSKTFNLVKNAVQVALATPTSSVLECFQVYQPVLFPAGAVDQTVSNDGTENTTTIIATNSSSSCQVLLMEHSFGYSYGMPFVG